VGASAPPEPPEYKDQWVVDVSSQVPDPPTQNLLSVGGGVVVDDDELLEDVLELVLVDVLVDDELLDEDVLLEVELDVEVEVDVDVLVLVLVDVEVDVEVVVVKPDSVTSVKVGFVVPVTVPEW
jgi:hypothetical protein